MMSGDGQTRFLPDLFLLGGNGGLGHGDEALRWRDQCLVLFGFFDFLLAALLSFGHLVLLGFFTSLRYCPPS
jgi:hypothetical protein